MHKAIMNIFQKNAKNLSSKYLRLRHFEYKFSPIAKFCDFRSQFPKKGVLKIFTIICHQKAETVYFQDMKEFAWNSFSKLRKFGLKMGHNLSVILKFFPATSQKPIATTGNIHQNEQKVVKGHFTQYFTTVKGNMNGS